MNSFPEMAKENSKNNKMDKKTEKRLQELEKELQEVENLGKIKAKKIKKLIEEKYKEE